jgi:hypothetical protein
MWHTPANADSSPTGQQPHIIFHIDVARIKESSSLVYGAEHPGLVYTANDSGDGPYVYVLNDDGQLVGTTTLAGVKPVDVEAMTPGPDGTLIVGDVGDNDAERSSIQIYEIPEPTAGDRTVTPQKVTLTYADGARNAESMLYDPSNGRVLVVSKEAEGHVYTTPPDVFSMSQATLTSVASSPSYATDATFLPGDVMAIIRTYVWAYVFDYPSWRHVATFRLPRQQQGESITSVPSGDTVWVGSEGVDSPVWSVPLPPGVRQHLGARGGKASAPPGGPNHRTHKHRGPAGDRPTPRPARSGGGAPARGGSASGTSASSGTRARIVRISESAGVLVVVAGLTVLLPVGRRRRTPS